MEILKFLIQNQSVWPQELERVSIKRTQRTLTRKKIEIRPGSKIYTKFDFF